MQYTHKLMLAPMVRVGTLPMRLLSLKYGADIVYSPETIDKKLANTVRVQNDLLGTVDFIHQPSGSLALRIHPQEREKLIVQLGTADPHIAVQAALKVAKDAAGIDVNCGCPKKFSISGGMGAALLTNPVLLDKILRALVQNVPLPITCKIRIFENLDQTLDLVRMIEKTGVKAIAVHCRTRAERPKDTPHWEVLASIVKAVNVPIIANGDVFDTEDLDKLWQIAGINSFMVARGAQANASVFRPLSHWMQSRFGSTIPPMLSSTSSSPTANPSGNPSSESQTKPFPLATPLRTVMRDYLRFALDYDMPYQNAKYTLVQMLPTKSEMKKMDIQNLKRRATEDGDDIDDAESLVGVEDEDPDLKPWTMDDNVRFSRAKSMKELAELLGLVEYHDQVVKARNEKAAKLQREDLMLKNSNGEYDSEFPYVPDAPYIPPKKKRHLDPSADQDLAAVAPAAGVAPTKIETPLQPPQALNAGITVTQEVP